MVAAGGESASPPNRWTDSEAPTRYLSWSGEGGTDGELAPDIQPGATSYTDPHGDGTPMPFEAATWSSPVVSVGDFSELVASWNATTPAGTWVEVSARVWPSGADTSPGRGEDFVLGRWASDTTTIHRTSVPHQRSEVAVVDCDVLAAAAGQRLGAWQLRVTAYRRVGGTSWPALARVGAVTSPLRPRPADSLSDPGPAAAAETTLEVPTFSQMTHRGRHLEYGGGGEAWCSAASTAMVLTYWGRAATEGRDGPEEPRPAVVDAAVGTYDYAYGGTGNWSFNAAYAATFGLVAAISRLDSLAEAEAFIQAGIPLVASLSFSKGELAGAGYGTDGHLLVLVGFTAEGDVVVNDPASHLVASNDEVRTVYDRGQFERLWQETSGGLVYVIRPPEVPAPPVLRGAPPRW